MRTTHWRSLDELARSSDFRSKFAREFPGKDWESLPPATRRQFLKLMGASAALAGLSGCRWPTERIVPASRPAGYIPGKPLQFATSMEVGGHGRGLLITSYDGRPIKVEGNPDHPIARGASDSISQASILELYDPDRSQAVARRDGSRRTVSDWEPFTAFARERFRSLRDSRGAGLRILSEATSSPSLLAMRSAFLEAHPEARWFEFEPVSRDNERAGAGLAFGRPFRSHLDLSAVSVVLCLDADILMTHPAAPRHARDHAAWRQAEGGRMNRLHAVEAALSLTGSVADHRYPVRQSMIPAVAGMLLHDLLRANPAGGSLANRPEISRFGDRPREFDLVAAIAADLTAHRGRSLVVAGPRRPAEVHALVHLINHHLDNVGHTIHHTDPRRRSARPGSAIPPRSPRSIKPSTANRGTSTSSSVSIS